MDVPCYDEDMDHLIAERRIAERRIPQVISAERWPHNSTNIQCLLETITSSMDTHNQGVYMQTFRDLAHYLAGCFHMSMHIVSSLILQKNEIVEGSAMYIHSIIDLLKQMQSVVASTYVRKCDNYEIADHMFNIRTATSYMFHASNIMAAHIPGKMLVEMLVCAKRDYYQNKQYIHGCINLHVPKEDAQKIIDTLDIQSSTLQSPYDYDKFVTRSVLLNALTLQLCDTLYITTQFTWMLYHPSATLNINISSDVVIVTKVPPARHRSMPPRQSIQMMSMSLLPLESIRMMFHHINPKEQDIFARACKLTFHLHQQHALQDTNKLKVEHGAILVQYEQTVKAMRTNIKNNM